MLMFVVRASGGEGSGERPYHGWRWCGSAVKKPLRQHLDVPALLQAEGRKSHARAAGEENHVTEQTCTLVPCAVLYYCDYDTGHPGCLDCGTGCFL